MKDLYEILEIERTATVDEIKASYRRLAKKYHPDLNDGDESCQERFKEITAAYEVLGNEEKRRMYDAYGTADGPGGAGGMHMDFGDIFGDIFDIFTGGGFGGTRSRSQSTKGEDIRVDIEISLEDTLRDQNHTVRYRRRVSCDRCHGTGAKSSHDIRTCPTCHGRGQVRTVRQTLFGAVEMMNTCSQCHGKGKIIAEPCPACEGTGMRFEAVEHTVTLYRGLKEGDVLRPGPYGHAGENGGPDGDLYIVIHVKPASNLHIEGENIYAQTPITFPEAALGAKKIVQTLDGEVEVILAAGTQHGDVLRIPKRGLYRYRSEQRGDFYLVLSIEVPTHLTERQKELLRIFDEGIRAEEPPPSAQRKAKVQRMWYRLLRRMRTWLQRKFSR